MAVASILGAQEKERARVARELHDDTGQALTLLLVRLQVVADQTADERVKRELADLRALVAQTIDGVRRLSVDLSPTALDDLGLASAIEWLVERACANGRLRVDVHLDLTHEPRRAVALVLFRVAQEAVTNAVRHANATQLSVRLDERGGVIRLVVADDGKGFDVAAAQASTADSVGLLGMYERIALVEGDLLIASEPGRGTRVVAHVPAEGVAG